MLAQRSQAVRYASLRNAALRNEILVGLPYACPMSRSEAAIEQGTAR
jgi:hypothetical protein